MNISSPQPLSFRSSARRALAISLAVLTMGIITPRLQAQSDNFNDGNDTAPAWTHYSLPDIPPNLPPPYPTLPPPGYWGAAAYSFPDDANGGKAYRIFAPGITNDPLSMMNARAGSFRPDTTYTGRFSVGADLLSWNASWRQEAGLIYYFQDIDLGTSDGYTTTYSSAYQNLYISRILDEAPSTVSRLPDGSIVLNPTHRYRLVASTHDGITLLTQLFDLAHPTSPWASVVGQDATYNSGFCGLFVFEQTPPPSTMGADATFDNYVASVPADGTLPATVTDLSPPPAGKTREFHPTVTIGILDRDTTVDTASIVLSVDGVWIPNAALTIDPQVHKPNNPGIKDFSGATVTYVIPELFPWSSTHTNSVAFRDSTSTWRTNTWSWTIAYPYLFASNSLPLGCLSVRGFEVRMVQSDNNCVNLANTLARARQQLAIPPQIAIDRSATGIVQVLDWDKSADPTTGKNVPGLCAASANPTCFTYNNIAVESVAYLELGAGLHRFRINSDDRAGLYSGVNLADVNAQALWENPGNTANTTFDFVVEAAGLYPVRCLWEETGGGAVLHLWSTNVTTGDPEVLVNDPTDPAGVIKAWYPLACLSAGTVSGPYAVESTAVNVLNTVDIVGADCSPTVVGQRVTSGRFTVPISGAARFYRLDGPRQTLITRTEKVGANLEITYQVQ